MSTYYLYILFLIVKIKNKTIPTQVSYYGNVGWTTTSGGIAFWKINYGYWRLAPTLSLRNQKVSWQHFTNNVHYIWCATRRVSAPPAVTGRRVYAILLLNVTHSRRL